MQMRYGFVSNSSSTAFIIRNTTNTTKTLLDFVKENSGLLDQFLERYDWYKDNPKFTQQNMEEDAKKDDSILQPKQGHYFIFGDEDGTTIGHVYDYILRYGGQSESFKWKLKEYLR